MLLIEAFQIASRCFGLLNYKPCFYMREIDYILNPSTVSFPLFSIAGYAFRGLTTCTI